MGSEESHFNVSIGSDGHGHKTVSTNNNLFEEKGQPKRYRTKVLPSTSLTPYRQAKQTQDKKGLFEVLLYVHRNRRLIHLDFLTAPEL